MSQNFRPLLHKGRITIIDHSKGYGKIIADTGEDVIIKSPYVDLQNFSENELVVFEMKPVIKISNKFYAENVTKTYRSRDGYVVTDRRYSHIHRDLEKRLKTLIGRIDCEGNDRVSKVIPWQTLENVQNCIKVTPLDEFIYAKRVGRTTYARFVKNKKCENADRISIILEKEQSLYIITTCYYGELPEDVYDYEENLTNNYSYWRKHAFVWGTELIQEDTVTTRNPWTGVDEKNTFAEILRRQ